MGIGSALTGQNNDLDDDIVVTATELPLCLCILECPLAVATGAVAMVGMLRRRDLTRWRLRKGRDDCLVLLPVLVLSPVLSEAKS